MYKTGLQQYCHQQGWSFLSYSAVQNGPSHMPRFRATVNVCGNVFPSLDTYNSIKDAQNNVAFVALEYFNSIVPPNPTPVQPRDLGSSKANLHRLCTKKLWSPPHYRCTMEEGPDHDKKFTFQVVIRDREGDQILAYYGNPCTSKKAASQNAAQSWKVMASSNVMSAAMVVGGEAFTDKLVEKGQLVAEQKEQFKDFMKKKVRERKKANHEAREARRKAREEMGQEGRAALENMKFYKFYPVPSPETPDVSRVKIPFINRYYGKAHKVMYHSTDDVPTEGSGISWITLACHCSNLG